MWSIPYLSKISFRFVFCVRHLFILDSVSISGYQSEFSVFPDHDVLFSSTKHPFTYADSHLTGTQVSVRLIPVVARSSGLTTAPDGGLKSPPVYRFRGVCPSPHVAIIPSGHTLSNTQFNSTLDYVLYLFWRQFVFIRKSMQASICGMDSILN